MLYKPTTLTASSVSTVTWPREYPYWPPLSVLGSQEPRGLVSVGCDVVHPLHAKLLGRWPWHLQHPELINGIRGVGDELPDKHLLLGVQRPGRDVQEHSCLHLKLILCRSKTKIALMIYPPLYFCFKKRYINILPCDMWIYSKATVFKYVKAHWYWNALSLKEFNMKVKHEIQPNEITSMLIFIVINEI